MKTNKQNQKQTKNKIRKNKQNKINKQKNKKQTNMLTSMKDKSSKYCIIEPVVGDRIYEDVSHICQPTIGSCNISQVSYDLLYLSQ
jgi:hypothetical protein